MKVPQVIASGVLNDRAFIVEQFIAGHHPRLQERGGNYRHPSSGHLVQLSSLGFGTAKAFPSLSLHVIQEELASVAIPEQMTYERECRDELIRRIRLLPSTTEHPLVTAFGHGDLSVGNIVVPPQAVFS